LGDARVAWAGEGCLGDARASWYWGEGGAYFGWECCWSLHQEEADRDRVRNSDAGGMVQPLRREGFKVEGNTVSDRVDGNDNRSLRKRRRV